MSGDHLLTGLSEESKDVLGDIHAEYLKQLNRFGVQHDDSKSLNDWASLIGHYLFTNLSSHDMDFADENKIKSAYRTFEIAAAINMSGMASMKRKLNQLERERSTGRTAPEVASEELQEA